MFYRTVSSLDKSFPDMKASDFKELTSFTMLSNERYSFQLFYDSDPGTSLANAPTNISLDSQLKDCIKLYKVRCVPAEHPVTGDNFDEYYERTKPGLFPDVLEPMDVGERILKSPSLNAIWFEVEPCGRFPAGSYPITVVLTSPEGEERITVSCEIIGADLPEQELIFTQWFHVDCLRDYYKTGDYDAGLWRIIGDFAENASRYGQNMILTPVLSPELDTYTTIYRTGVQLARITVEDGRYSFDFSRVGKWIRLCEKKGIKYFEINHLFSQWGAAKCPQVWATENGTYRRIFGWENDADSPEYLGFLKAFLPTLVNYLKKIKKLDKCFFHISDEPNITTLEHYGKLSSAVKPLLGGRPVMDALSDYDFYAKGICDIPIPSNDHIGPFIEHKVPGLWTYYCCGQWKDVSNRFFSMPSARNRAIGVQFWKFNIKGFLQWGYNFYNSFLSFTKINPFLSTDGDGFVPSGDTFSVYPGRGEKPMPSLREVVFFEGLQDMRALYLLEKMIGKEAVLALVEDGIEPVRFDRFPYNRDFVLGLRERINLEIKKHI
ncbi:MAG: DUF4091 domain-containing protein [Clostridia bacterium]|nr:DUF4091 domain-containing protein [Clostridia bacterium]